MASRFVALFDAALARHGDSLRGFARSVGADGATLAQIRRGRRKPPLGRLEAWADALSLTGDDREAFLLEGRLLHAPPEIQDLVRNLMDRAGQRAAEPRVRY